MTLQLRAMGYHLLYEITQCYLYVVLAIGLCLVFSAINFVANTFAFRQSSITVPVIPKSVKLSCFTTLSLLHIIPIISDSKQNMWIMAEYHLLIAHNVDDDSWLLEMSVLGTQSRTWFLNPGIRIDTSGIPEVSILLGTRPMHAPGTILSDCNVSQFGFADCL